MKKGIIALLTIVFFCNFGRVEYSALNPKSKIVKVDSTFKSVNITSTKMIKSGSGSATEQETSESTEERFQWTKYVVLGFRTLMATLLKLLVA